MRPLEQTQREFFAALQMPLRGRSRRSTELPPSDEGHSPEFLAKADELMKPGANLSSAERLELYHRQYWFRVLDSIAEDFPVLRKMAGERVFWSLMEAYLSDCPSASFTLAASGQPTAGFYRSVGGDRRSRAAVVFRAGTGGIRADGDLRSGGVEIRGAGQISPLPILACNRM